MEIVVSRPKQYVDRARAYEVFIDGRSFIKIKAGEEIRLTLPKNAKIVLAKIDWCSSNEFNLSNIKTGEKIEITNAISSKAWIPFYVIYAITFKRKSYLNIAKVS